MQLQGKIALITGGAHRVGKAITMMLAAQGADVIVNYNRSAEAADATVAEAKALGVSGRAIQCDVSQLGQVNDMADQIEEQFGGVDIIINSASLFEKHAFPTDDIETWHTVTRILIDGPFYICNRLVPKMRERGGGAIINIVDLSVWEPWSQFTAHAVGKSALLAFTRQLALELAPTIRVNAVAPGPVMPPPDYEEASAQKVAQRTLLKRWGSPDDVAQAVQYLLAADYVTAEVIRVDGGELYGCRTNDD